MFDPITPAEAARGSAEVEPQRLLLVDDNPTNLRVLFEALEEERYELLIAQSGEEALEIAPEAQPALILLDINMPGIDGFETCRRLKADPRTADIAVIFLSARNEVADKVHGLRLGAVDYVSKPFQFEEVVARVGTQLELKQAREELERAKLQVENLLRNMLPVSIVERLRAGESHPVDPHGDGTILFADLVGFTPLAARLAPEELIEILNRLFSEMDRLAASYGLEKIKTIGDAYMVAGGIPEPRQDHAAAVASFALELLERWDSLDLLGERDLSIRIGMHSGPVAAGVIGTSKFAFDLWGDTVNTASRMESSGLPGHIHLSADTRERLGEGFQTESRGLTEIRGKGEMETFFLLGRA